MAYKVALNTSAYKHLPCSEKNWEPGTLNNFMDAINGWCKTESSVLHLKWRLNFLAGHAPYGINSDEMWERYKAWEDGTKKNYVKYRDVLCGFDRKEPVKLPGFCQGYFDVDKVIEKLKKDGYVQIKFSDFYDIRQAHSKNLKGCFIEIVKI